MNLIGMQIKKSKILVIGFGTVGQGFYELFHSKRKALGLEDVSISEIVDMKYGHIIDPDENILDELKGGRTYPKIEPVQAIKNSDANIVCEFTWLNLKNAEPAFTHIRTALALGKNVITTNKGPSALKFKELNNLAVENGVKFLMKGTVMAGTPSYNILKLLPGIEVKSVRGIMNGTTNFILGSMEEGNTFEDALKKAQQLGYAEADPSNDVDGFDAAAKIIIISNLLGWNHEFNKIEVKGIRDINREQAKQKTKLIAYADKNVAYVKPMKLSNDDILANVNGVMNAIEFETDTLGKIYSMGPGAGRIQTAQAAMTDLLSLLRK
jgi:homoserine dehydrogenase